MKLWKFTPVARPDDPRWLGHTPVRTLFVAAESASEACVVASRDDVPARQGRVGNESGHSHSRFGDEKLYRVDPGDAGDIERLSPLPDRPSVIGRIQ